MTTLKVTPNPAAPGQTVDVDGTGFDPTVKFALETVDAKGSAVGQTSNINRPRRDGSFGVGINVPPVVGPGKVRAYQRSKIVASVDVTIQKVVVVPTPPPSTTMPVGGDPARRGPKPIDFTSPGVTPSGTALADLEAAEAKAGTGGLVRLPAGVYATLPFSRAVLYQLDPNAIIANEIRPRIRGCGLEGGETRGGVWLGVGTDAHDFRIAHTRVRDRGIFNESRSGLVVLNDDFQRIAGECVRAWYDSPAHADVHGLTIENCTGKRTSYSVNGVGAFTGNDGGGVRKLYGLIRRNNQFDNGADKGQGPGGLGAFALSEFWGCVGAIVEYNDDSGGGFLNSNVRDQDGVVRWNRGRIEVGRAWAFWESGGTGTGGTKIYENEILGQPARNGVVIATATPNPVRTVEVFKNRHPGVRPTSDGNAPGYSFHDNDAGPVGLARQLAASIAATYPARRRAPGEAAA